MSILPVAAPVASTEALSHADRVSVNIALKHNGRVALAPVVEVVRPSRDIEPEDVPLRTNHITAGEAQTLHASGRPLARQNARAKQLAEELVVLGAGRSQRARLQPLLEEVEQQLCDTQGDARAAAHVPCLNAVDALLRCRAASYAFAAQVLADEARMYEAAGQD